MPPPSDAREDSHFDLALPHGRGVAGGLRATFLSNDRPRAVTCEDGAMLTLVPGERGRQVTVISGNTSGILRHAPDPRYGDEYRGGAVAMRVDPEVFVQGLAGKDHGPCL